MVLVQGCLAVGEPFRGVVGGDMGAAGLADRTHEPLGAFFVDVGDPHCMHDHRPQIRGLPRRRRAHHIKRRRRHLSHIQAMLARQGREPLHSELQQFLSPGFVASSVLGQMLQQSPQPLTRQKVSAIR